jgi:Uma2 family endonuclease
VILDAENTVQPDALLRRLPDRGGLTRVNEEGYLTGPPELIVEVASSSAAIDMRDKRRACCTAGPFPVCACPSARCWPATPPRCSRR